ncbi:hypothetical protein BH09DEP1_BH09DEP1_0370 [soil metagenome]
MLLVLGLLISIPYSFAMERPIAPGHSLQRIASSATQAIKGCCADRGYGIACAIAGCACCEASARYVGYSLLIVNKCCWKSSYMPVKDIIQTVEATQVASAVAALVGINAYYFKKHFKVKKD